MLPSSGRDEIFTSGGGRKSSVGGFRVTEPERIREDALRIHAPFRLRRRGVETKLVLGNPTKSVDRTLLRNIANALSWLDRIKAGKTYEQIATEDAIPTDRVRKAIRYAFLAPDIVRAIVEGRQPVGLTSGASAIKCCYAVFEC